MAQFPLVRRQLPSIRILFLLCLAAIAGVAQQPTVSEPIREQLLNGLRILMWPQPAAQDVTLKLRIHSGAAFDLAGKSGEMALLGDILFPDPATIEFFTEEMAGKLDVKTDHDSLTVTMQGRANEFERIVEILRNAILSPQVTPDIVARQRARRLKIVQDTAALPTIAADRAIAARYFGDYPYGRPANGTVENLASVDRSDLMLARDRFLNADNATLTVTGGIERTRAMRALRQLLGSWRKAEQVVPATFRMPAAPDPRTLIVNSPADQTAEVRLAVRGVSRGDADYVAAEILARVARQRWAKLSPELNSKPFFVRNDAHVLPGLLIMGASINSKSSAPVIAGAKKVIESLVREPATATEVEQARSEVIAELTNKLGKPDTMLDVWLDSDTYRLPPISDQLNSMRTVSAGDVQRLALRLFQDKPLASIVLGNSQQLKTELEGRLETEVLPDTPVPNPTTEMAPARKPNSPTKPE